MSKPRQQQLGSINILDTQHDGYVDVLSARIINVGAPILSTDVAPRSYIDGYFGSTNGALMPNFNADMIDGFHSNQIILANGTTAMAANLNLNNNKISNVAIPTISTDATNKAYVDGYAVATTLHAGFLPALNGTLIVGLNSDQIDGYHASQIILANGGVSMAADLNINSHKITGVLTPTLSTDAVNKAYIDGYVGSTGGALQIGLNADQVDGYHANQVILANGGVSMTASLNLNNNKITSLGTPTLATDAATKAYIDGYTGSTGGVLQTGLNADQVDGYHANTFLFANGGVSMSANLSMGSNKIINLSTPTLATDAATKAYIDGYVGSTGGVLQVGLNADQVDGYHANSFLFANGAVSMSGNLNANSNKVINLAAPTLSTDAVNKNYVDGYSGWNNVSIATNASIAVSKLAASTDGYYLRTTGSTPVWSNLTGTIDGYNLSNIFEMTGEPSGFPNRTDSTLSVVDGTRTLTIAPVAGSFFFYVKGNRFVKTAANSVTWTDVEGVHFFYFNTQGVLTHTTDPNDWVNAMYGNGALTAALFWDSTNDKSLIFNDERHGFMNGPTHAHFHNAFGTQWYSGGGLYGFNIGSGTLATDAYFGVTTPAVIADEDIKFTIIDGYPQALNTPAYIPIYYKTGTDGYWRMKTADAFPIIYSGTAGYTGANGRLPYNQLNGATWQLTQASDQFYVLCHYFAVTDLNHPIIGILGQSQYSTLALAQAAAATEIATLNGVLTLLSTEHTALGTVIWQTRSTYTNVPKARIQTPTTGNYVDFRGNKAIGTAASVSDHSNLSGLSSDDHLQYVHISIPRTITTQHTFNPVGAPFIIGASATNYVVSGLNADQIDGYEASQIILSNGGVSMAANLRLNNNISLSARDGYNTSNINLIKLNTNNNIEIGDGYSIFSVSGQSLAFNSILTVPTISQDANTTVSTTGAPFTIKAQNSTAAGSIGAKLALQSGTGTMRDGYIEFITGTTSRAVLNDKSFFITNTSTPSDTPVGGGYLYAEAGAGKWKGSSGTVTTFGPAEPHCPRCGRDFAVQWVNKNDDEELSLCMACLDKALVSIGIDIAINRKYKE